MTDEAFLRRTWRLQWLGSIEEFTNIEIQRRAWLNADHTNPHYSYTEYRCCYFDDLGLSGDQGYATCLTEGFICEDEFQAVSGFHQALSNYMPPPGEGFEGQRILADPAWEAVVEAAKACREELLRILTDPQEITALTKIAPSAVNAGGLH
jgi:hypothetical protein